MREILCDGLRNAKQLDKCYYYKTYTIQNTMKPALIKIQTDGGVEWFAENSMLYINILLLGGTRRFSFSALIVIRRNTLIIMCLIFDSSHQNQNGTII